MKLKQTIERSKKGTGGIIGEVRQSAFVSEWELVYHETFAMSNAFSEMTRLGKLNDSDLNLHHELSGGYSKLFSESIQKVVTFINERENPFKKKFQFLCLTFAPYRQTVLAIDYFIHGNKEFTKFRQE